MSQPDIAWRASSAPRRGDLHEERRSLPLGCGRRRSHRSRHPRRGSRGGGDWTSHAMGRAAPDDSREPQRHRGARAHHGRRHRHRAGVRLYRARLWRSQALWRGIRGCPRPRGAQLHDGRRLGRSDLLMDSPRRAPIHLALTRPLLLAGAERELVLMNGTLIAALIFGVGFHWASLTMAILLCTVGHWGLTRAAKHDPQLCRVYVRHIRYQEYYPARAAVQAPPGYVFPSVAD